MNNWRKIIEKFGGTFKIDHFDGPVHATLVGARFYFSGEGPTISAALDVLDSSISAETMTVNLYAQFNEVHRNTVLRWIDDGKLRAFKGKTAEGKSAWLIFASRRTNSAQEADDENE